MPLYEGDNPGLSPGGKLPWREQWRTAFGAAMPQQLRSDVVVAQYHRINALAPWLYLAIASMAVIGAYGSGGPFSWFYHLAVPSFFVLIGAARSWVWHRRQSAGRVSHAGKVRRLKATAFIALTLSVAGSAWTLDAFYATLEARRVLAPVFVAFVAIASAIGISALPRAAIGVLAITLLPPAAAMIASPDVGVQSVGMSMAVLMVLLSAMVCHHFATLVASIQLARELSNQAQTDPLTGLANRRGFRQCFRAGEHHTLVTIDLNEFKAANDRFGHDAGDAVLVEIASRLRQLCPDALCIARLGGDEFAILLEVDGGDRSADLSVAISRAIPMPVYYDGDAIMVGAAIGRATGNDLNVLLRDADAMLYRQKRPDSRVAVAQY